MASKWLSLDMDMFNRMEEAIKAYSGNAEEVINDVLWNEGGQLIRDEIVRLLPRSGRTWKGKKKAAKDTMPFSQFNDRSGEVLVKTKSAYGYLYFPNDGANTYRHEGGQDFMFRGAENQQEEIINRCITRLTEIL